MRIRGVVQVLAVLAGAGGCPSPQVGSTSSALAPTSVAPWPRLFVRVEEVPRDLVAAGVVVLDARDRALFNAGHIPGAQRAEWSRWRQGVFIGGTLPEDLDDVARDLAKLGVDDHKRLLVCGVPVGRGGFGEDGRVAWLLRYLGHPAVAVLDGGCDAWPKASQTSVTSSPVAGSFTVHVRPELRAQKPDVVRIVSDRSAAQAEHAPLVDVRTRAEYDGATPYFESRGGRIPGAVNVEVTSLFDAEGHVRSREEILALLAAAGVTSRQSSGGVVAYCTGGVRSALASLAFESAGVHVKNYDGSFWEWSADKALAVEK